MIKKTVFIVTAAAFLSGCPVRIPSPRVPGIRGPRIEVGPKITAPSPGASQQQYARQMSMVMFSYMFAPGGFWPWLQDFKAGEYSKWDVYDDSSQEMEAEIAYLGSFAENRKWWRLSYSSLEDADDGIFEALVDHSDFTFRRIRAKIEDGEIQEVPVTEDSRMITRPQKLTSESVQGATVGRETVNVPAGSFDARILEFGLGGGGQLTIWANEDAPGGVVKYELSHEGEKTIFNLREYGSNADTVLNSF